jgi:hypothetical protein
MTAIAYVLTLAILAGTMFYGYHLTHSGWWWWMVVAMLCLEMRSRSACSCKKEEEDG